MVEPVPLPGRRVEPEAGLVNLRRVPWRQVRVAADDRTLTVQYGRGVPQRLHAVVCTEREDSIDVAVVVGWNRELFERAQRERMVFTLQLLIEHTVVTLDNPVRGRRLDNCGPGGEAWPPG